MSSSTSAAASIAAASGPNAGGNLDARARRHMALPALERHVETFPLEPISLVLITHVLDTAVPFIEALNRAANLEAVLAIPYSLRPAARDALADRCA